jgi:hypothetical protein
MLVLFCFSRFTEDEFKVFKETQSLWGRDDFSKKLVLAFTFGDLKVKDFTDDIQAGGPDMQQVLQAAHNRYVVFNNRGKEFHLYVYLPMSAYTSP